MFKKFVFATALFAATIAPVCAKNLAVPDRNPVATMVIPNSWDVEEIEFGYSAVSPDEDVFFSVEYASAAKTDKMTHLNEQWLKEQEITPKGKSREDKADFGGLPGTIYTSAATDPDGDTVIQFMVIDGGHDRAILLTLWASQEAREANKAEIDGIIDSFKAIK